MPVVILPKALHETPTRERARSIVNGVLLYTEQTGTRPSCAQLAKALRIKRAVQLLKRNGRYPLLGKAARLYVAAFAMRTDEI